jgi:hypothetical protein
MKQISQETASNNVNYIVDGIQKVIRTFGKRTPGSQAEADAQEYLAGELKHYADEVRTEKFKLHPMAFMGWIYFDIAFLLAAVVCLWFNLGIPAILLVALALLLFVYQLLLYVHVTAKFFPEKTSTNVYAVKKPTGEVRRRIVFCGHADAAPEWGYLYHGGAVLFEIQLFASLSTILIIVAMAIAGMLVNRFGVFAITPATSYGKALLGITVYCVPVILSLLFFFNPLRTVDGANDNLTSCFTALSVLKTMKEEQIQFEHTEVCALMAGSEEAGLRGAMAFAKAHKEELSDVETVFIVMETLRESEHFSIYTRDMNGIVKTDMDAAKLVQDAAEQAIGRKMKFAAVTMGATDAAAFALAGMKATCLAAMNHKLQPYYHTRKDSYDNLSPECLESAYKIAMKTLEIYDKKGL